MPRKYPEKVTASMTRFTDGKDILLLRHSTAIQLGSSNEHLGMVIMTNPGKFEFNKSPGWHEFKMGAGTSETFVADDFPDLSMQNVIEVIRRGHETAGLSEPSGIIRIYNLSNVRQPDGKQAEAYHKQALKIVPSDRLHLLEDPVTHSRERFLRECIKSRFVIMGFVDGKFADKMQQILDWSEDQIQRRVYAVDDRGRCSHPRRWRTEKELKNRAIESIKNVLLR
ncbi:hypothetical protein LJK88_27585 [Paenibacillus sp. P26]|nr:hypothetical protein LJK88_27585 [Paenibacillus sp. P26]UUZ94880.1 hypothetical protein LJK87_10410 [Paenibacillus sp. P25]